VAANQAGVGTDQPGIADYGIIGDCRTAALVSREGSIDWLCLPRFDGPSVFGALLDTRIGGRFRVSPVGTADIRRRYLTDTNVLETTFRTATGVLTLTDAMTLPRPEDPLFPDHEILRRVECTEGAVEVRVVCDPRFDYGLRIDAGRRLGSDSIQFDGGGVGLVLRSGIGLRPATVGSGWIGRETLEAGQRRYLSLTTGHAAPVVLSPLGDGAEARLDHTADWWRAWVGRCAYRGEHRDPVFRGMLTLKLLAYPPSGAVLAAATTSLPEDPGGIRNWDYRYCWLRDASMTIEALLHLGFTEEAEAFLGWLLHATRLTRPEVQVVYDVHGRTHHSVRELDHLSGYRGSRPVRVGNDASDQFQLDVYGEVLRSAWSFARRGGTLDRAEAKFLADLGEAVCEEWGRPDNGVWEVQGERRHYTHSKAMCWVALHCLLELHGDGHLAPERSVAEIEAIMERIRRRVEEEGWSQEIGSYVAWFGSDNVDAALLLLGLLGYDDASADRIEATRRVIRARLGEDGLLRRYRYDDRLPGREGAFGICAFWEAQLLARQGHVDAARARFDRAAAWANDLGLFSEEVDPRSGALLGNFPQAFTHIGLVSAATEIARALGRPPEARARPPGDTRAKLER
jgi:GH15 family glucan-1,4-alpha-glucosidase